VTDAWDVGEGNGVGMGLPVGLRRTVGNSRWPGIVVDTVGVVVVDIVAAAVDVAAAVGGLWSYGPRPPLEIRAHCEFFFDFLMFFPLALRRLPHFYSI
jgi:hypothetical protein